MANDDYELMPRNEVEQLKTEISKLKKNPLGDSNQGRDLLEAVNELNSSIKRLIDIFVSTQNDLAKEYSENNPIEDLKNIKDQNEEIAKGIVALADMIKEPKKPEPIMFAPAAPQTFQEFSSKPPYPEPVPQPPKAYPSPYADSAFMNEIPAPQKVEEKRKGFLFRK